MYSFAKVLLTVVAVLGGSAALAFCGFYVAKIDADLFNQSSEVIIARDGDRTVLTMANDFQGEVSEFAMVVPIPYVFKEEQVQVGDPHIFERIGAYSAPRLVEYFDADPCTRYELREFEVQQSAVPTAAPSDEARRARALGVTVEEQFSVGEYDILILGAEASSGLETWLRENGYALPAGASEALAPYLAMDMKFFVAKVNLEVFEEAGFAQLRPLMMAFESEQLMLPIQLGMINAAGPQDLTMYLLSPQGRIEVANYETLALPSDVNVPAFVEDEFGEVYSAIFQQSYERAGRDAVFLEYAWDMAWCDPCAAVPLSPEELRQAGVFWLTDPSAPNVYLTRLHVRYTPDDFPEDLRFRVTDERENMQGRYVIQRPFGGELRCEGASAYVAQVQKRQQQEARTLAELTGWSLAEVEAKQTTYDPTVSIPSWWERVFEALDRP